MKRNNFSPFPFFNSKEEQVRWYAYGNDYEYLCPERGILPFQIKREHIGETIYEKGTQITDYTSTWLYALDGKGAVVKTDGSDVDTYIATIDVAELPYDRIFVEYAQPGVYVSESGSVMAGVMASFGNELSGVTIYTPLGTFGPYSEYPEGYSGEIEIKKTKTSPLNITAVKIMSKAATSYYTAQIKSVQPKGIERAVVIDADTEDELFELDLDAFSIVADSSNTYDYILCNGLADVVDTYDPVKRMYIKITDGTNTFYSAYFTWCNPCMSIEWYDKADLLFRDGQICYSSGFKNKMYFCAELGMPSYEFEEEVSERNGYSYPLSQVSYKKYKFNILAPEEVCDVMRLIRLSDVVTIKSGDDEYSATSFLMTPTWQEQGYLANIECEFATDTMVKKTGKGYYINE